LSTDNRSPYIHAVMSRLSVRNDQLRGIVSPSEVKRLCGRIRELLAGNQITPDERTKIEGYTRLQRCFTSAEADSIASMHSVYATMARRKQIRDEHRKKSIVKGR